MKINSINATSFGAKSTKKEELSKEDKKQLRADSRKRYFENVSKNATLDSMKVSVGREEEDGKFKFASAVTGLGAFGTALTGLVKSTNVLNTVRSTGYKTSSLPTEKSAEVLKKLKQSKVLMGASVGLALASMAINSINQHRAEKTANERGFLTLNQKAAISNLAPSAAYEVNNLEYSSHVK